MDYLAMLKHHFKPSKGWMNDPNGLVTLTDTITPFISMLPITRLPLSSI